jgi:hypothetical protein
MNIYQQWGFGDSPFQVSPLPPSALGEKLLIGRDDELKTLKRRLFNPPKISTIEGLNGVGKTSLVNVAAYQVYSAALSGSDGPLLIPCNTIFQLSASKDSEEFIDDVLMAVAQTLIERAKAIGGSSAINAKQLDSWLNAPQVSSLQGSLSIIGNGGGIGKTVETNTSSGFERSGFRKEVLKWLSDLFPTPNDGAVICTIDNLELLQTSDTVRHRLEELRDKLLNIQGLRWVLCGALGIVLGTVSSPRLEGFLHSPIEVLGVDDSLTAEIYNSRISAYSNLEDPRNSPYLPLCVDDFERLYEILHRILRSTLSKADSFCQWVADNYQPDTYPADTAAKRHAFSLWLSDESSRALRAANDVLRPRAWRVFEDAIIQNGVFSPSDYDSFGFNSLQAFRPYVKALEDAGLLVSTQDEGDKRRKTIQITALGWLVKFAKKHS